MIPLMIILILKKKQGQDTNKSVKVLLCK